MGSPPTLPPPKKINLKRAPAGGIYEISQTVMVCYMAAWHCNNTPLRKVRDETSNLKGAVV